MKSLLESGAHFGHQTRRWNPKMKPYIFTARNGIHIIDLQQTITGLTAAYNFVVETVAGGGKVLFVGTKKQAQEAIAEEAARANQFYHHPALARRHADQLFDHSQAAALPGRSGRSARPRRFRAADQGRGAEAQRRDRKAQSRLWRRQEDGSPACGAVHRRPAQGGAGGQRGAQSRHPDRRDGRYQLRSGSDRLCDPNATTTRSAASG